MATPPPPRPVVICSLHAASATAQPGGALRRRHGVELLMAVTFCTEIEYIKRNSLVGLSH